MKNFNILDIDIEFFQHEYAQAVSSDTFDLYLKAVDMLEKFTNSISEDEEKNKKNNFNAFEINVLDLGTGNGILLLMLAKDYHNAKYTGIEILEELSNIAKINFDKLSKTIGYKLNFNIINADYCKLSDIFSDNIKFDLIISNPPYFPLGKGKISSIYGKAISRFEIMATLNDLINCIKNYLAKDGRAFVIYPFSRKDELLKVCDELFLNVKTHYISSNNSENHHHIPNIINKNTLTLDGITKNNSKSKIIFEIEHA